MRHTWQYWGQLGIAILLCGCAALEGNVPYSPSQAAPPVQRGSSAQGSTARQDEELFPLGPEDVLEVSIWNHPELSQTALIGPDGRASLKLVGSLGVGGMTLPELKRELTGMYQEFVPEAEVTVSLKELNSFRIYVLGKVSSPGEYKARSRLSVLQALALAGGLTPFAKDRAVRILRRAGSRDIVLPFDYRSVMDGTAPDVLLQPGDRVLVP